MPPGPGRNLIARLVLAAALAALPGIAAAQATEKAAFLVMLGNDTVAAERFTRSDTLLAGTRAIRVPRAAVVHYAAHLGRDGAITRFEMTTLPGDGTDTTQAQSSTVSFQMDSVRVTVESGDSVRRYAVNPAPGASIFLPFTYSLYENLVRRAVARGADTLTVDLVFPGVLNALRTTVIRRSPREVTIDFFGDPLFVRTDRAGRILALDASATTQKVRVTRHASIDVAAVARAFAERELREGAGPLSRRDTVRATVGAAELTIDYGRPLARGRVIMGSVVPLGRVWRTGANAATGFTTTGNITIGGVEVPAGSYTLFTLPVADGAMLIVNRQTGQWGTEYDPAQDLVRIPLARRELAEPMERFTIAIEPADGAATLRLAWERTEWTAPIAPR